MRPVVCSGCGIGINNVGEPGGRFHDFAQLVQTRRGRPADGCRPAFGRRASGAGDLCAYGHRRIAGSSGAIQGFPCSLAGGVAMALATARCASSFFRPSVPVADKAKKTGIPQECRCVRTICVLSDCDARFRQPVRSASPTDQAKSAQGEQAHGRRFGNRDHLEYACAASGIQRRQVELE